MIPELGKYHNEVLTSYGVTFLLLFVLLVFSLIRSRRIQRNLAEAEERHKKND